MLADASQLTASHHNTLGVNHTYHPVDAVLHLENYSLEHPARHADPSHELHNSLILIHIITAIPLVWQEVFVNFLLKMPNFCFTLVPSLSEEKALQE